MKREIGHHVGRMAWQKRRRAEELERRQASQDREEDPELVGRWKLASAEELLVVDQKVADLLAVGVPSLVEAGRREIEAVAVPGMG